MQSRQKGINFNEYMFEKLAVRGGNLGIKPSKDLRVAQTENINYIIIYWDNNGIVSLSLNKWKLQIFHKK